MLSRHMELGIYTFVELQADPRTGERRDPVQRMRDVVEEMALADELGLDVFAIGEHHRPDFIVSAPAVVLAAGAARTKNIRLSSAVSVISSDDPIRVFQDFATLDLLSGGRAEIMAGRGSFTESFPLFGYDLADYDDLFVEKLQLLLAVRDNEVVEWPGGRFTAPVPGLTVYPRPAQSPIPVWLAVGGNPPSAIRAGTLGLPMAVAIIGGMPERFAGFVELFRRAASEAGHDPLPPVSINSHGFIADSSQDAMDTAAPSAIAAMNRIGRERGWQPMSRAEYEESATLRGANFVGSPQQIIDKILFQHEIFQHDRFLLQMSIGSVPHEKMMRSLELFATEVAPTIRKELP